MLTHCFSKRIPRANSHISIRIAVLFTFLFAVSCNSTVDKSAVNAVEPGPTLKAVETPAEAPPCGGKMCYSISENKITIYNTPGETSTMTSDIDMPPDVISFKRSLIVYDKDGKTDLGSIDIQIDRKGIRSVTMKGKPIPKKE